MCNVKVTLVSNGTKEIIENVTQIDFDLMEIVVTTFFLSPHESYMVLNR